ncbi:DUF6268 family outer membrane beta-barrel protein [Eudoraea sp.]|uniref:DUF6268 family outer membrane beta-barrel protein n=1 Tax=Eudoraea sp. TaxID=1979955 RepID=UPI003C725261
MKYRTILIFMVCCSFSYAQDYIDIGKFFVSTTPQNSFNRENAGSTAIHEFGLQIDFPIVLDSTKALLIGGFANRTDVFLDPSLSEASQLYIVGAKIGLNQVYNEKWSGTYLLFPKMATDFSSGFRRGFQFGVLALFSHTKTKKLKYSYGLFYNSEEFGPLIVPIFGIYYKSPNDRLEASILLPLLVDINYTLGKRTNIGSNFDGIGNSFAISNPSFPDTYVNRNTNDLYFYFEYELTSSLNIRFKTGYSFFRNYRIYDENDKVDLSISSIYLGDNRTILNTDFKDGFVFKAVLRYRFNLPD